ncbi:hypothetical protein CGRA01v4_13195 [Colletotrichum graminicola]|uniref:Expansin-like EG45 domain-containing protein n=1 Tax=Colletotrichum graminicola (strain M1.001 / M2 / FGSC 10212) TaxID=645133 RepID=E3R140_COLGM|nr:uncharacterized protein GLRG_11975 [Colletotrichum graminicola M1.001]EFQ36828.1 hypothetical protein GLRG_11975 [Colletotrichum graminicola M1.001]WDK21905.1 hypothetical protein CGRA01v4_13195 [Colletotrichum graminicola]
MIPGHISHYAVAILAALSAAVDAKACKARHHHHHQGKPADNSTASVALPPQTTPPPSATTLATFVQASMQPSQANAAESPALTSSSNPLNAGAASTTMSSSAVAALQTSSSETFIGLGTRYGGSCTEKDCWENGACSFVGYDLPAGIDGSTCVSDDIWNNGANCGGCISVTYQGKTLTIMVTNRTGGNATHLDMTPDTWAKLTNGNPGGGVNGIEWEWITCPFADSTPLQVHMHGGASQYWFAAMIENATLRTKKLEVSSDQGATWKTATLHDPNMWEITGTLPSATCWVRVTSVNGVEVVVKDVVLQSGKITKATENY